MTEKEIGEIIVVCVFGAILIPVVVGAFLVGVREIVKKTRPRKHDSFTAKTCRQVRNRERYWGCW